MRRGLRGSFGHWTFVAGIGLLAPLGCADDDSSATGAEDSSTGGADTGSMTTTATTAVATETGLIDDTGSDSTGGTGGLLDDPEWPNLECDPLVPEYCGFPFPNNVFSVVDESTPTGRRTALSEQTLPRASSGLSYSPDVFNERDGFSVSGTILAYLPGVTTEGLADPLHIGDSIDPAVATTILLDADTGELFPHFTELDVNAPGGDDRALMIQPAASLAYGHRYIVAVRDLTDGSAVIPPSPVFAALRDGTDSEDPSVEARRDLYGDIFARLEMAGIERGDLQLAWDFTVSSREHTNGRMLHMRDAALEMAGEAGPIYEILSVDEDFAPAVFRRIQGEIEVPLFLDDPGPGGVMEVDGADVPQQNGVARYPFTIQVPYSAQTEPAPAMLFGHGLFGSRDSAESEYFQQFADDANAILVSLDWIGMSDEDPTLVGLAIASGDPSQTRIIPDRLHQSLVNFTMAARMMRTSIVDDPELQFMGQSLLDPETTYYYGGSQGGIMGSVFMALSTDVERGVLAVPGQPYNLLLERSVNFPTFADLIAGAYVDALDKQMFLHLMQHLWDRAEPAGYSPHVSIDPLPGTPPHEVLMLVSIGDHQVTTLGAHVMARSIGAANVSPTNREVWGVPEVRSPHVGSAMIEHDFGLPPEPLTNVPMSEGDDPHGAMTGVPAAGQSAIHFLRTGEAMSFCDGPCDPD